MRSKQRKLSSVAFCTCLVSGAHGQHLQTIAPWPGIALGINNSGTVIINKGREAESAEGYVWTPATGPVSLASLGVPLPNTVHDINDLGQMVGDSGAGAWFYDPSIGARPLAGGSFGVSNTNYQMMGLPVAVGDGWDVKGIPRLRINNSGQVVSAHDLNDLGQSLAHTNHEGWQLPPPWPHAMTNWADPITMVPRYAASLNNYGQILGDGWMWTPSSPNASNGQFVAIDLSYSHEFGAEMCINNKGQAIGQGSQSNGNGGCWLWTPTTPNGTSGASSNVWQYARNESFMLSRGFGINALGQIVGTTAALGDSLPPQLWSPWTPVGANMTVQPIDHSQVHRNVLNVTFDQVTSQGESTLNATPTGPQPPLGYKLGGPAIIESYPNNFPALMAGYYQVATTAGFTGPIIIRFNYDLIQFDNQATLRLFQTSDDVNWTDITTSVDTENALVYGTTTTLSRFALFERTGAVDTPVGSAVTVTPVDYTTSTTPVTLTFDNVTQQGRSTLTTSTQGPPLPSGFQLAGAPPTYYGITTTAQFTGNVLVKVKYFGVPPAEESELRLLHTSDNVTWSDITVGVDTVLDVITGSTPSFSTFAVVRRIAADAGLSTVSVSPAVISTFGGETTVTVTLRDGGNQTLGSGRHVVLSTTYGTLLGQVVDQQDGTYTQLLRAGNLPGTATISASADGVPLAAHPVVTFVPIDPSLSTVALEPDTTFLGGFGYVTVTPRNDQSTPVGSGKTVVLQTTLGTLVGAVIDHQDGTYSQRINATALGTACIRATVDGLALSDTGTFTVLNPANLGVVIGLEADSTPHGYASIQAAVNKIGLHQLRRILVTPNCYQEIVTAKNLANISFEALSVSGLVTVKGFKLTRCSNIDIQGFVVDGTGSPHHGIQLVGNERCADILIRDCIVRDIECNHDGLHIGKSTGAVTIDNCLVEGCGGDGIALHGDGGPYLIARSTVRNNGNNGILAADDVTVTITTCTLTGNGLDGQRRQGYGVLRKRANHGGSPATITLRTNTLASNRGLVIAGKSSSQLGNYDQIIDATDSQSGY